VLVGHSERREYFNESNEMLAEKTNLLLKNELTPIFCCGEVLEEREKENHFNLIESQLNEGLFHLDSEQILNCIIAYEPVWAIGTGVTASSDQAQEMHEFIRKLLVNKYGEDIAEAISILYGGSCKPSNAKELFANPDVDGGLIGGASLNTADFIAIANSF
jgi:triosephosphate isomerase